MEIAFSPVRPDADTLVFAVPKGGFDALPISAAATFAAGAAAARFTGKAGSRGACRQSRRRRNG